MREKIKMSLRAKLIVASTFTLDFYHFRRKRMLENKFKTKLCNYLSKTYPGCIITHNDPTETQGIPDITVLYGKKWIMLEGKKTGTASHRANQDYYVEHANKMSFARFIYPENEKEVLNEIDEFFSVQ